MVFVLIQQILPSTTSAQRPRPSLQLDSANFPTLELCGRGKVWSVDMYTSMSWDPSVPPCQSFPLGTERKPYKPSSGAYHRWALSSQTLCKSFQPSWLSSCHALSHLWFSLFHGKGIPTWDECPPAPAAIIATVADALARPKTAQSQLQREAQQWCTVSSTVCCGKWREDKRTLFYNIKNVTPFGNT